jgi:ATP/maltotriose-dependent transcriptional regulator MalT
LEPTQAEDPTLLASYEGLVISTSNRFDGIKRYDTEEVRQVLRVRVWRALLAWDPTEPRTRKRILAGKKTEKELRDAFVYGCIHNQVVDLLKRDKEQDLLIEDIAPESDANQRDKFEVRYMTTDSAEVFRGVEESAPLVPNTLSHDERLVLACAYLGYKGPEIAERLGMSRPKVANVMRSIRDKMRDWRPKEEGATTPEPSVNPTPVVAA